MFLIQQDSRKDKCVPSWQTKVMSLLGKPCKFRLWMTGGAWQRWEPGLDINYKAYCSMVKQKMFQFSDLFNSIKIFKLKKMQMASGFGQDWALLHLKPLPQPPQLLHDASTCLNRCTIVEHSGNTIKLECLL